MKPIHPGKIRWKCRRGMLELDMIFEKFFHEKFNCLSDEEKALFDRFLDHPDPQLYDWLLGHERPEDPNDRRIVDRILKH